MSNHDARASKQGWAAQTTSRLSSLGRRKLPIWGCRETSKQSAEINDRTPSLVNDQRPTNDLARTRQRPGLVNNLAVLDDPPPHRDPRALTVIDDPTLTGSTRDRGAPTGIPFIGTQTLRLSEMETKATLFLAKPSGVHGQTRWDHPFTP